MEIRVSIYICHFWEASFPVGFIAFLSNWLLCIVLLCVLIDVCESWLLKAKLILHSGVGSNPSLTRLAGIERDQGALLLF